eukprot:5271129-Pleurochrysis_carterae.AAC.1
MALMPKMRERHGHRGNASEESSVCACAQDRQGRDVVGMYLRCCRVQDTGLEVMWTTLATLRSSMADEFSQLCIEMVGAARSREGGTQLFEVFASPDGQAHFAREERVARCFVNQRPRRFAR